MSNLNEISEILLTTGPTKDNLESFNSALSIATVSELNSLALVLIGDDSRMADDMRNELSKEIRKRVLKCNFLLKVSYSPFEDTYQCYVRASTADSLSFSLDNSISYISKDSLSTEDLSRIYNILEQDSRVYITRNDGSYDITIEKVASDNESILIGSDKWNIAIPIEKLYDVSIRELIDTLSSLGQEM